MSASLAWTSGRDNRARFRDQVAAADPLRFPFDLPLVSRDQVGRAIAWPEAGGPVIFDPIIEGRFVWGDFDTIEFRPARPLRSGSAWTARVSPRLRAWDGSPLDRDQSVAFATPPLAWTALLHDSTTPDGAVVLALRFSDAVSPDQITGRIEVKSPRGEHLVTAREGFCISFSRLMRRWIYFQKTEMGPSCSAWGEGVRPAAV